MKALPLKIAIYILTVGVFDLSSVVAAPVTFGFHGDIYNVSVSGSPSSASDFEIGDKFRGQFTFEPVEDQPGFILEAETHLTSEFPFELIFDEHTFAASSIDIISRYNTTVIDSNILGSSLAVTNVDWLPGNAQDDLMPGLFRMSFSNVADSGGALGGANVPGDPNTWNAFGHRTISLILVDAGGEGSIRLFGSVTVVPIPEPATGVLTFTLLCLIWAGRRSRLLSSLWQSPKGWPALSGLGVALACLLPTPHATSAPLSFKFDAEIVGISGDLSAFETPSPIAIGDKFQVAYAFDSQQDFLNLFDSPYAIPGGDLSALVGGLELGASTNQGFYNIPLGSIGLGTPEPRSSIALAYHSPTDVFPGFGGHLGNYPAGVSLFLSGPEGIITDAEDLLDVRNWNRLSTQRDLLLTLGRFENGLDFHFATITARVGNVSIPEPWSGVQLGIGVMGLMWVGCRRGA